ncbi:MAG: RNA-binding protein [Verrucomicrobiota bacterium]|nr:RNA-binding protein [Limisphaera sp.]MDW8381162.1 RNA-binding protein [Verrucomicrobiota bacterium]
MNPTRLFVGNLSYRTMENDLHEYFSQVGVVTSVNVMFDRVTGKSRGFAFVEFATPEEAARAVEQLHNREFQGRTLTVNIARPREERASRSSGARQERGERSERSDRGERGGRSYR